MSRRLVPLLIVAAVALGASACAGSDTAAQVAGSATAAVVASASSASSAAASAAASSPALAASPGSHVVTITSDLVAMPDIPTVTLPAGAPTRIVSLATGVGETLAALGVGDRVVGRDETSSVPQIASAELVTKAHATNAEKVLSLKPDLVLVDAATAPKEAIAQIKDSGVRVVEVPEAWTLTDLGPRVQAVADAVQVPADVAAQVITEAGGAAGAAPSPAADAPRVAFIYVRGTSAIYLVGGKGSGADALLAAAGAVDAGAAAGLDAFTPLTAEAVATMNPDVILVMTKGLESVGGVDGLVGLPGVAQTRAGQERRVVAVDDTLLLSFGPRTGRVVDSLRSALATSLQ